MRWPMRHYASPAYVTGPLRRMLPYKVKKAVFEKTKEEEEEKNIIDTLRPI